MMAFVLDCHPEIAQFRRLNPGLSAVRDLPEIRYFSLSDSTRREARDNWRRNYYDKRAIQPERDADLDLDSER
jgi:hypothetical protein